MKTILCAVPTAKYVEPDTFKSIYDLVVPDGYKIKLEIVIGDDVTNSRNLVAEWAKRYDYLLAIDSDIVMPPDTLVKMINADKDIISGLYIQRKENEQILEIYQDKHGGGVMNIPYNVIANRGIIQIAACGFGCVLIKSEIFRKMEYPHFLYHSAIDHANTYSEDLFFCAKARNMGYTMWADTSILCEHIGSTSFKIDTSMADSVVERIASADLLPPEHSNYLKNMNIQPKVVYDIGACVLHWTRHAKQAWPNAEFILFDAEDGVEDVIKRSGHKYHIGVLTDEDHKERKFYHNINNLGGNSYYKEVTGAYAESDGEIKNGMALDTIVKVKGYPLPDLIKMDVQGAELDILKGAQYTLSNCKDVILEAQHKQYNAGAPNVEQVIAYMESIGFKLVANFTRVEYDGDYHFTRVNSPSKAYIIRSSHPLSVEYAKTAASSCDKLGIKWEYFNAIENKPAPELWGNNPDIPSYCFDMVPPAACATESHIQLWKKIRDNKECAIILEHDAIMLHKINMEIPDNIIVALGYKLENPTNYHAIEKPCEILPIKHHHGAHAYCINHVTANTLLNEIKEIGIPVAIDDMYFTRYDEKYTSRIPLGIMSPTPAIGWIRESTIWNKADNRNAEFIDSFKRNLVRTTVYDETTDSHIILGE